MDKYVPFIALLFLGMSAADCGGSAGVRVWEFQPEEAAKTMKGWYRGEETKTFGETDVKYGVNAQDMEFILNRLRQCEIPPGVKIDNGQLLNVLLGK